MIIARGSSLAAAPQPGGPRPKGTEDFGTLQKAQAITTRVEERGGGIFPSPQILRDSALRQDRVLPGIPNPGDNRKSSCLVLSSWMAPPRRYVGRNLGRQHCVRR